MAYIDLNPIRAGQAQTPETSDFTSIQARIEDRQAAQEVSSPEAQDMRTEHGPRAGWMAPIPLDPPRKKSREKPNPRRASNKGCLPMSLETYLKLVDWTGRQIRQGKRGTIASDCTPILERLQCNAETWLDYVVNFRAKFRNAAGTPISQQAFRDKLRKAASLAG